MPLLNKLSSRYALTWTRIFSCFSVLVSIPSKAEIRLRSVLLFTRGLCSVALNRKRPMMFLIRLSFIYGQIPSGSFIAIAAFYGKAASLDCVFAKLGTQALPSFFGKLPPRCRNNGFSSRVAFAEFTKKAPWVIIDLIVSSLLFFIRLKKAQSLKKRRFASLILSDKAGHIPYFQTPLNLQLIGSSPLSP